MMTLLSKFFSSLPLGAIWTKLKFALLVLAVSFMFWQGLQMTSLQKDVENLEAVQTNLQEQVKQVEANYKSLQINYQLSAKTGEDYVQSLNSLQTKSTELERSFAALEKKSLQGGTTPRVTYEKRPTGAHSEPEGVSAGTLDGSDLEWRKLLDDTYCQVHPTNSKCAK